MIIIAPGKTGRWGGRILWAAPVARPLLAEGAAWRPAVVVAVPVAEVPAAAREPVVPPAEVVVAARVKPVAMAVPAVAMLAELAAPQEAAKRALLKRTAAPAAGVAEELAAPREAVAAECVQLEAARMRASAAAVPMVLGQAEAVAQIASRPVAMCVQLLATTKAACVRPEPMETEWRFWHQREVWVQLEVVRMAKEGQSWSLTRASLLRAPPLVLLVPLEKVVEGPH